MIPHDGANYYAVLAVDLFGNKSKQSKIKKIDYKLE